MESKSNTFKTVFGWVAVISASGTLAAVTYMALKYHYLSPQIVGLAGTVIALAAAGAVSFFNKEQGKTK